eukprot:GILJ01000237.1.p1 GENE.GILJ01000237.1~~GILJ01000237.1.p1  ORF type:complete len:222 (+),score=32.61 GILJ01000237.1:45-710(+)
MAVLLKVFAVLCALSCVAADVPSKLPEGFPAHTTTTTIPAEELEQMQRPKDYIMAEPQEFQSFAEMDAAPSQGGDFQFYAPESVAAGMKANAFGGIFPGSHGEMIPVRWANHFKRREGVNYMLVNEWQECLVCQQIFDNSNMLTSHLYNLCPNFAPEIRNMCHAQQKVLQSCHQFVRNWCYEDQGGVFRVRSPCPKHLMCHYCLGINPLYCVPMDFFGDQQ